MKRARDILLLIGMVLSIVTGASLLLCGIACIVCGANPALRDVLIEAFNNIPDGSRGSITGEQFAAIIQGCMIGSGVAYLVATGFFAANAVFSAKARLNGTKGLYILCIVFGALASTVTLVGGIFGLIVEGKEERRAAAQQIE